MQVKESVNASNFLMSGSRISSENNTSRMDKKSDEMDFASFLVPSAEEQNAVRNTAKNIKYEESTAGLSGKADRADGSAKTADDFDKDKQADCRNNVDQSAKAEESVKTDCAEDGNVDETDPLFAEDDQAAVPEMDLEDQQDVLAMLSSILQVVMKQFNLSAEELAGRLDEFGMEAGELLTADGIKEFFMNMKNADVSDLLTDEKLNQEFQEFMNAFGQIMEQSSLDEKNMESVEWNASVTTLLENAQDVKDYAEKGTDQVQKQPDVSEGNEETQNEPEVLVSRQSGKSILNENQTDSQRDGTSSTQSQADGTVIKEAVPQNENGFENPILHAIHDAMGQVQESVSAVGQQPVSRSDIINQIVEQVRVNLNQDTTSIELQLYPEHLGKIQINVVSKDGIMTARIVAETETARQAIEGGLFNLKETMEQQNLKVDAIEVMISTAGFEKQKEEQDAQKQENGSKSKRRLDLSELNEDMSQNDEAEALKMQAAGSSVSYSA